MKKPIILAVDDEQVVLNAIETDLRNQYHQHYRIMKSYSGKEALELIVELKQRNDQIALFLVDQRMPEMEGVAFLSEAMKIYPQARKVLLTAYADTQAAIAAINTIGLDHYLMKPWSPPEELLYPILDDLLSDWMATADQPFDGIRVAGTLWSPHSHAVKDFLARSQIPYRWLDIEKDQEARNLVEKTNQNQHRIPVVYFPDGDTLVNPDIKTLAEKIGMHTRPEQPFYDLIIVGAGPAGLASAVYGASEGLRTLLIDKETTGGQAGTSSRIDNYLGFPKGISGADLARRATAQATRLGAEILTAQEVVGLKIKDIYRVVTLADGTQLSCHALVIATGASLRTLEVPGVQKLTGAGIYYGAALTEAAHYRDTHMVVVGGANSAGQGAMFFSRYASQVTMLVRGNSLKTSMSRYLIEQIAATPNIEVRLGSQIVAAIGEKRLEALMIHKRKDQQADTLKIDAAFIFIGERPYSDLVSGVVDLSHDGFILTGPDVKHQFRTSVKRDPYLYETSVPGIFAVADVRFGAIRRVASAVGEGSAAISSVHQYLKTV